MCLYSQYARIGKHANVWKENQKHVSKISNRHKDVGYMYVVINCTCMAMPSWWPHICHVQIFPNSVDDADIV